MRLDTGLNELKTRSIPSFFSNGMTSASLKASGKTPVVSEMFNISVITGNSKSRHSFNNEVGMGSILHDFVGDRTINFLTSSMDNATKSDKFESQLTSLGKSTYSASSFDLSNEIISEILDQ